MSNVLQLLDRLGLERLAGFWWRRRLYRCLECGAGLRRSRERLACSRCGARFPIINGVAVLLRRFRVAETQVPPPEASLRAVCEAYRISADNVALQHLSRILGKVYQFDESSLEAENNYILQRLNIDRNGRSTVDGMAVEGYGAPRFTIVRHYIPGELPCGAASSHNVRIRNTGGEPLTRYSSGGWQLTARWIDSAGQDLGVAAKPSRLPVSVLPGRELTVPFWLQAPSDPGEYRLEFSLTADDRHLSPESPAVSVRVSGIVTPEYAPLEPVVGPLEPDYDEDHRVGIRIMERMVQLTGARRGLEIGGSSCPMTTNLPAQIVNTDIDAQTLQITKFVFSRRGHRNVTFACCDAMNLPFAKGAFDFAAIFACLHHLADPAAALCSVARVIKPDGFLAVMCEPVGHYYDDPDAEMQEVLEHGINEQRFSLDEYARMFHYAGLRPNSCQMDHDSLKVILTRRKPGSK